MGISGHILGDKKLRKVARSTGVPFTSAFIRNREAQGVVIVGDKCLHYWFDPKTWEATRVSNPTHWASCPERSKHE